MDGSNFPGTHRRLTRARRRGASIGGALLAVVIAGTLATTAVVVTPRYLPSASAALPPQPESDEHRRTLDLIAGLVGRSRAVLAVHPRDASPYAEIVLWLEDANDRGRVGREEIALLSHSRALHTISFIDQSSAPPEDDDASTADLRPPAPSDMTSAAFSAWWRQRPDVRPRRIATGVSDMRVEVLPGHRAGRRMLRISLTWSSESSDAPDEATVLVDVPMRHADDARPVE